MAKTQGSVVQKAVKNLHAVLAELDAQRQGIQAAIQALTGAKAVAPAKPKRTMSAAARKKISEAQKARWAKAKKVKS